MQYTNVAGQHKFGIVVIFLMFSMAFNSVVLCLIFYNMTEAMIDGFGMVGEKDKLKVVDRSAISATSSMNESTDGADNQDYE